MSKNKFLNNISYVFRTIWSWYGVMLRKLGRSLWSLINYRSSYSRGGFVLPTVVMVLLVVSLLSLAILLRSFDRAETARSVKVNQKVLIATLPALERASAKIDYLLAGAANGGDPTLPPGTPAEDLLFRTMEQRLDDYTFQNEEKLLVRYDLDGNNNIEPKGESTATNLSEDNDVGDNEQIETAWRYPVDTDNNGKYDAYTIYGIFIRSPKEGQEYQPLQIRTPPQPVLEGLKIYPPLCEALNTSSNLISGVGWYKSGTKLKKSVFVYTVNVPIMKLPEEDADEKYELYKGTTAVSGLEYQRDYSRNSIINNAVFYENDLEAAPGFEFNLNGKIVANGNMMLTSFANQPLKIYQVSGRSSCFYETGNSKIFVGGELIHGRSRNKQVDKAAEVHLFQGEDANPKIVNIDDTAESVNNDSLDVVFNDNAYAQRINLMVQEHIESGNGDPETVDDVKDKRVQEGEEEAKARRAALENYFKERTRKVPFSEVPLNENVTTTGVIKGSKNSLRPIDDWMLPTKGNAQVAETTTTTALALNPSQPAATRPSDVEKNKEEELGDRIKVGNNLPALRYDESLEDDQSIPPFVGGSTKQYIGSTAWSNTTGECKDDGEEKDTECRWRETQITPFADVGNIDRNSFWEIAAARKPETATEGYGGLRVITGAGVYERENSFLPEPKQTNYNDPATPATEEYPIVWSDMMPMSPIVNSAVYDNSNYPEDSENPQTPAEPPPPWNNLFQDPTTPLSDTIDPYTEQYAKGDLRMRATVVYHYARSGIEKNATGDDLNQEPIACISSYYDPSDEISSQNRAVYAGNNLAVLQDYYNASIPSDPSGKSNNGIVYGPPTIIRANNIAVTLNNTNQLLSGTPGNLIKQANLVFPDGRFANKPLRDALVKVKDGDSLSIADQAAIDSTQCALEILDGTLAPSNSNSIIPHGAIKEVAFLNPREIKAIDKDNLKTPNDETFTLSSSLAKPAKLEGKYQLPLEERQPLEIRATQIDMNVLRMTEITNTAVGADIPELKPEYLLPYSGIVYASRDDALPDRSDRTPDGANGINEESARLLSPTDYKLDPTRRPNGIMLVNGEELNRGGSNSVSSIIDVVKEKGLILISNVPTYIKGDFNLHDHYEFLGGGIDWNFTAYYNPDKALDPEFACRGGDPRIPGGCGGTGGGDKWRPVEIMSDSLTILSKDFRAGFRNEGDFDLRNNAGNVVLSVGYDLNGNTSILSTDPKANEADYGFDLNGDGDEEDTDVPETDITTKAARLINGFYGNDFAVNGLSSGAQFIIDGEETTYTDEQYRDNTETPAPVNSSYFNNFVTPVQRRANFNEYLMEMCLKLPVSACQPEDWKIYGPDPGNPDVPKGLDPIDIGISLSPDQYSISGTTTKAPSPEYQRFPRRVAFLRDPDSEYGLDYKDGTVPIPLSIDADGNIVNAADGVSAPSQDDTLWFATQDTANPLQVSWTTDQPLFYRNADQLAEGRVLQPQLVPVLQIHATTDLPEAAGGFPKGDVVEDKTRWQMPVKEDSTVNVFMAVGDTPPRVITNSVGETNGGLPNLPRFMENWKGKTSIISGAFVQLRRSAYSTGPYQHILENNPPQIFDDSSFDQYNTRETSGTAPASTPPTRQWSYDVGLLSQSPDLFANKLSSLDVGNTRQYYREVSFDDPWIQTLLCSKTQAGKNAVEDEGIRPTGFCNEKTGG